MNPRPGRAASVAIRRPAIYSHYFNGANVFIPSAFNYPAKARMAEARLRSAARLSFTSVARSGGRLRLAVRVTNTGAGHSLPTGITEIRQMWLRIIVRSGGKTVYASGMIGREGTLDREAHLFNTVLGDRNGQPVTKVWRAVKLLRDRRVPAGKSLTERYVVAVPSRAGRLQITATLLYRSAPQDLVDLVVTTGKKMKVPVVEMARASTAL